MTYEQSDPTISPRSELYRRGLLALGAAGVLGVAACSAPGSANHTPEASATHTATASPTHTERSSSFAGFAISGDEQVHRLAEYKEVLADQPPEGLMIFTETPADVSEAKAAAPAMAEQLKTYSKNGLTPYVIMEPTIHGGAESADFVDYGKGRYDAPLKAYFSSLKQRGVTDKMLGVWVSFPEANSPAWNQPTSPEVIGKAITRTAQVQKSVFPASKAGVMLNSMTYPNGSKWENGRYSSLVTYAKAIPRGLIDSFGLQGFPDYPYSAPQSDIAAVKPDEYLDAHMAIDAARALGSSAIWFNTGTLGQEYAGTKNEVHVPTAQRLALLQGVLQQAAISKRAGFKTTVNLFADDKSAMDEKIDWSYMHDASTRNALKGFARGARSEGVALSIFDAD